MGWVFPSILAAIILYFFTLLYLFASTYERLGIGKAGLLAAEPPLLQFLVAVITASSLSLLAVALFELKRLYSKRPSLLTAGWTFLLLLASLINLIFTTGFHFGLHTSFSLLLLIQVVSAGVFTVLLLLHRRHEEKEDVSEEKKESRPSDGKSLLERGAVLFLGFFVGFALLNVLYLLSYQPLELKEATVSWKKLFYRGKYRDFAYGNPVESTVEINSYLLELSREFGIDLSHNERARKAFERRLEEGLKEKKATVVIVDYFRDKDKEPHTCLLNEGLGLAVFFVPCAFTHGELVEKTLKTSLPEELQYRFVRRKAADLEEAAKELPEEFSRGLVLVNVSLGALNRGVANFEWEYRVSHALTRLDESGIGLFQGAGNLRRDWRFGDLELAKQVAFVLPNITTVGAKEYQVGEFVAPGRVKFRWPNGVELSVGGTSLSTPIALGAVLKEEFKKIKNKKENP